MLYDPKWEEKVKRDTMEPWRQVLLDAADLLERKGWTQGRFQYRGRYCVAAAIERCGHDERELRNLACDYLHRYINSFRDCSKGTILVVQWNDGPFQNKQNVIATLRDCANQHG